MKKWMMLFISVVMVFTLAACSGNTTTNEPSSNDGEGKGEEANKEVTLRIAWWGAEPRHDYTLKMIELYEELNPHVKIQPEYASWDDYWKKLAPQASAGQLPDIIQMDLSYIIQYGNNNQLADLAPYLGNEIDTSDLSQNFIDGGKIGDKYYGMNGGVNALSFQYDPEALQKIGVDKIDENWTWDDYKVMADKAVENGIYFENGPGTAPDVTFNYYLRSHGERLYSEDGTKLGYEDDQLFVDFYKMYADMVNKKAVQSPDESAQVKGLEDDPVVKQQSIGLFQWSNQLIGIQSAANRPIEIVGLPGPNAEKGLFLKPGLLWSIANNSENKAEAAKFIDFYTNNIEANKLMLGDRGVPGSPKVQEALLPLLSEPQKQVFNYVAWVGENSSPYSGPDPAKAGEIISLLRNITEQIAYGVIEPEEAATQFREQADSILNQ
ncbi:ABC transporter substrate-binding protein [Bacillus sp. PS06]|uniref:ABC transporter substrate-binding protein n=1 Tax=Bacillus sp. PS06 TaxID=2764176 RepID=UPI0017863911|nr:ABC transporter substrate-binding protein [Bacillus sp. PS06]MBD8068193.1 carbohydrate ABC transporter substrate-binding protein [Bacillus sp. PS06]